MRKNYLDTIEECRTSSLIKDGLNPNTSFESFMEGIEEYYKVYSIESIKKIEYSEAFIFYIANNISKQSNVGSTNSINNLIKYMEFIENKVSEYYKGDLTILKLRILKENNLENIPYLCELTSKLNDVKKDLEIKGKEIYEKYMNLKEISNEEENILFAWLEFTLDDINLENIRSNVFEKICKYSENCSFQKLSFALNYASRVDYELSDECPSIYLCDFDNENINGENYSNAKSIFISKKFCDCKLIEMCLDYRDYNIINDEDAHELRGSLPTLYHELQHERQEQNLLNGVHSKSTFFMAVSNVLNKYYSNNDFNEYECNYLYREIENEANMVGNYKAQLLSNKYKLDSDMFYNKRAIYYRKKFAKGIQVDSSMNRYDQIFYNIIFLQDAVKNNPEVLGKYDVLNDIFEKDGSIKSFQDFVKSYTKITLESREENRDNIELLNYLFSFYMHNIDSLNITLDTKQFDSDIDKISLLMLISNTIKLESNSLKDMFDTLYEGELETNVKKDARMELILKRANSLLIAHEVFEKLRENGELERLISISNDHNSPYYRHTNFTYDTDGSFIRTIKEHVIRNINLSNIDEIMYIAETLDDEGERISNTVRR